MPAVGENWKQFKLLEPLGRGGMGEVFLAEDSSLNRNVALKFLPEGLQRDETARERFLREARSAAALDHPYICKIYEIGEVDGKAFIAMEYVEGVTLQDKLRRGALPLADILQIGIEIGEAVEAAHKKQIIHRDLKTPNIMVTLDGHIKVMDFGLAKQIVLEHAPDSSVDTMSAKLTENGSTPGTVIYMSPEQVRGELLDTRSDIFSVGVLLYETASGRVPFQGATSGLTYDAILNRGPVPLRQSNPDVPAELEQIIGKALEKDREVRYQNIREMVVDLKRLRRDSDTETLSYAQSGMSSAAAPARRSSKSVLAVVGAVVGVLVTGWLVFRGGSADLGGDRLAITSLAVLPFESNDPEVDYLADGIAESLINQLSQLPQSQLSVMARSTAFRYRGDVDPQKVGDELGVGAVLTGRIVQQGDILNVQAELVDAEKGTQLWGHQYEYPLDDLLSVQSDLAGEISQALRLQLTGEEQAQIAASGTADSVAYQAYLRGRFLWTKRTNPDFVAAIDFFEEAREKDPNYALAYAGLADTYFLLGAQFYGVEENYPPTDAIAQARSSALEALRLDENLAEPHATLGFIRFARDMDWGAAELNFLAAIDNDPDYPTARQWYALYLSVMGRYDEAIEQSLLAVEIEPTSWLANQALGNNYLQVGRYEEGKEQLETALQLAPEVWLTRSSLMAAYWTGGEREKAVDIAEAYDPVLGHLYQLASEGRLEEARDALASAPTPLRSGRFIVNHLVVGDRDAFFDALESGIENRDPQAVMIFNTTIIDSLRSEPRMIAIRQRMGLPP